ncbi:RNA helicase [Malassezia brasiliensis]|uniref:ATP-dependent RNA helicase n=1 Tax=Malassezia brasiliensis TaxID=1821822 RepID=A0AAF0IM62_9BASI|nr:RNA helicase [Malassezia brasiliensis]
MGKRRAAAAPAPVRASAVPWKNVPLSSQAENVNETTDEGFDLLDMNDDDFMGLQAVEGYDVEYEPDASGRNKTVRIVEAKPKGKGRKDKAALQPSGAETPAEPKDKTALKSKKAKTPADAMAKPVQRASSALQSDSSEHEAEDVSVSDEEPETGIEEAESLDESDTAPEPEVPTPRSAPLSAKARRTALHEADDLDVNEALAQARTQGLLLDDDSGDDGQERADAQLPGWRDFPLLAPIKRALHALSFATPTDVQAKTLPLSLGLDGPPRDVVGVAETGSGKTLAYGLPVLQYICQTADTDGGPDRPLEALVLTPTRELALQVTQHLRAVSAAGGHFARVATVCGGMSVQKQQRLLEQRGGAHIVVATPGRLWDVLKQDDAFARRVRQARFLVIDEADRMVETGHFAEMDAILRMVQRTPGPLPANDAMQTLVFSATMAKALQQNVRKKQWRKKRRAVEPTNTLDDLLSRVDFRDAEPAVVELVPERRVAANLLEAKIECVNKEKDTYLYYLLMRYPGRTLVFLNSIDGVRRLTPILSALDLDVYPLHGQLQQQQRLRNLDRFRSELHGRSKVLLATDVAARGIDVEGIDHVVHFQVPRTADAYVHRSGRTARAGHHGISVVLVEPSEQHMLQLIWKALQRTDALATLPIEYTLLDAIRTRLALAKEIDQLQHRHEKASHEDAWIRKLANEADLDLESDSDAEEQRDRASAKRPPSKSDARLAALRAELRAQLARPITPRGVSQKYLTSGVRPDVVQRLLQGDKEVLGIKRSTAHADLSAKKKRRRT